MENGRRALERGRANAFAPYVDFDAALRFMQENIRIWEDWMGCEQALHVRYEDLLTDYDTEAGRLMEFLRLSEKEPAFQAVVERYRPEQARSEQKGIHFSQGRIGRFRQKMSAEQQGRLQQAFGPYLEQMGYPA
jgi:hypothetical protein